MNPGLTAPTPGAGRGRACGPAWALFVAMLLGLLLPRAPQAAETDEMRVQAAYVLNFIRYSRWPAGDGEPIVIAVLGTAQNAAALRDLATRAGAINGRRVVVRLLPLSSVAPAQAPAVQALTTATADAHILFVGSSHSGWSRPAAQATSGRPVLTVGPGRTFVDAGGMFGLFLEQGHVRFAVNAPAIRGSGIDVSARLLALARGH